MSASDSQKRAASKFRKKTYDKMRMMVRKDSALTADDIRRHAEKMGETTGKFLNRAIKETIQRDNNRIALTEYMNLIRKD